MKESIKTGLSFGLTSAIVTTLGLIVGLNAGTHSKLAVIGGIFTIAIADSFSDALGIHISEESENVHTNKHIWESTLITFLSKFLFALTFLIPIIFFDILEATIICIFWGLGVLSVISYKMSKAQGERPVKIIAEHIIIALVVIVATHFAGTFIYSFSSFSILIPIYL